jgi:hypothetical protein
MWHAGGATIRESVGRFVANLEPTGAGHRAHWQADLFLTSQPLTVSCSRGGADWIPQEARIIPSELPDQIMATLLEQGIFNEPLVLVVNDHVPLRVISHGNRNFDD